MSTRAFSLLMFLSASLMVVSHFLRGGDVSDFTRGVVAGIWIGLLLVGAFLQTRARRS